MRELPPGDDLLDCAARALRAHLLPQLDAAQRTELLMALRAMAIAARQLRAGDAPLRAERDALAQLLGQAFDTVEAANRALAAAIRAGAADPGQPQRAALLAALRETVRQRLLESNPKLLGNTR